MADIFRQHGDAYRLAHVLTPEQARALRAICACRTAALGGHLEVCDHCGFSRPAYNSCRNRHCPKCQAQAQATWVDKHVTRILPTHYFHVVFTLPAELRNLVHRNRRRLFELLFESAAKSLTELGESRLRAKVGITAVLHTWTRDMNFHPHVHCLVTGGGLLLDETAWVKTSERYLFPFLVISRLFKGKFLAGLTRLYEDNALDLGGAREILADPEVFRLFKDRLYKKDWVVYQKPPFAGPEEVYRYLGRYTHRIAISNHRLLAINEKGVRFKTKHGKVAALGHLEFIRRFLLHVLPRGFHKIRHFGLLAASHLKGKLQLARSLLGGPVEKGSASATENWRAWLLRLTGVDFARCPICTRGTLVRSPLADRASRAPPLLVTA